MIGYQCFIKSNECVIAVQYKFVFLKGFITILFDYFSSP